MIKIENGRRDLPQPDEPHQPDPSPQRELPPLIWIPSKPEPKFPKITPESDPEELPDYEPERELEPA